jgi:type IV secretory pathway VirB2 component (pilin)
MDTVSSTCKRRFPLPSIALAVAVSCAGIAADAAASAPPSSALQKLAACMKPDRSSAAYKKANAACASLRAG